MIKFLVNDDYLEVSPGTSIDLEFNNPMFSDTGTHSFEITFPNSRRNRRILNFPGRIANLSNTKQSYDLAIISGSLRLKGTLNITETGSDFIKGYYAGNNGSFNILVTDKNLTDIESEETEFEDLEDYRDYANNTLSQTASALDIIFFPIYNPNLYDDHGYETTWKANNNYINRFDKTITQFNEYYPHLIPQFKLNYVLKNLFTTFGFDLTGNFLLKETDLKNIVLLSDVLRYRSRDQYSISGLYNYAYIPSGVMTDMIINIKNYMLRYGIKEFLSALEDIFCAVFFIHGHTIHFITWNELLSQAYYEDLTDKAYDEEIEEKQDPESGYSLGYDWDDSDENIDDFEIGNFNRIDDVESVDDLPSYSPVAAVDHLDELCLVTEENAFYLFIKTGPSSFEWAYLDDNYYPVKSGDEDFEISAVVNIPKNIWDDGDEMFIPRMLSKAFNYSDHPLAGQGAENYSFDYSTYAGRNPRLTIYREQIIFDDGLSTDTFVQGDLVDDILTIIHNLGTEIITVTILDNLGQEVTDIDDESIIIIDENEVHVDLYRQTPLTGTWTYEVTRNWPVPVANSRTMYRDKAGDWHEHTGAEYSLLWEGEKGLYEKFWKNFLYWKENFRKFTEIDIRWKPVDLQNLDFSKKYRVRSQDYFIKKIHVKITASGVMEFDNTELVRV